MATFSKRTVTVAGLPTPRPQSSSATLETRFCGVHLQVGTGPARSWSQACLQWSSHVRLWSGLFLALGLLLFFFTHVGELGVLCLCVSGCLLFSSWGLRLAAWLLPQPTEFHLGEAGEAMAARALGFGNETTIGGRSVEQVGGTSQKALSASVRSWVQRTKLHFGTVGSKQAEIVCVSRWLAEQMKEADMRDKDARRLIPLVARLAGVPDADDIFAKAVMQSAAVELARVLAGDSPTQ